MFDWRRPISHEQNGPAASGMLLHAFMHESVAEVRFAPLDGQWLAILCVADTEHRRPLCPGPDELPTDLSPSAGDVSDRRSDHAGKPSATEYDALGCIPEGVPCARNKPGFADC